MSEMTVVGALTLNLRGIGVLKSRKIGGMLASPISGTTNGSDSPNSVCPSMMQVARARTWPNVAGMFGSTHEPSGIDRHRAVEHADCAVVR